MNTLRAAIRTETARRIAYRNGFGGRRPITRLVSPGDLGQLIKPFVFLDWFELDPASVGGGFGYHPHSGIATFTTLLSGSISYEDTTGKSGVMDAGSVEWMRAGKGVWHTGHPTGSERVSGFQLWVALPPELETANPESIYLHQPALPSPGAARVLLGSHGESHGGIAAPSPMNYFHVSLEDGEEWTYHPPEGHDVAWVAVHEGGLETAGGCLNREIAVFEESGQAIEFVAHGKTSFVLGSAAKHPHSLVLGPYSVHTSRESLRNSLTEIERIGRDL